MADDDDEDHWQYSGSGSGYRDLGSQPPYKQGEASHSYCIVSLQQLPIATGI